MMMSEPLGRLTIGTKFISLWSEYSPLHFVLNEVNSRLTEMEAKRDWRTGATTWTVKSRFYWRSADKRTIRYNIAFKDWVLDALRCCAFWSRVEVIELEPQFGEPISMEMADWFSYRDGQEKFSDFLTTHPFPTRILPAHTGAGKTATTLDVLRRIGLRSYIFFHPKLLKEWQGSIAKFLPELGEDDVVYIAGADAIIESYQLAVQGRFNYKLVLFSLKTVETFVSTHGDGSYGVEPEEYFRVLGGGVKVVDEAHQWLQFNAILDGFINTAHNIYLTATLMKEIAFSKKMENMLYPVEHRCHVPPPPKHINFIAYSYILDPSKPLPMCKGPMGYSHHKFEKFFRNTRNRRHNYFQMIYEAMKEFYFIPYGAERRKALVFFSTTQMVAYFVEWLREKEPGYKIDEYVQGSDTAVLADCDVVVSTEKKSGTGTDIPGLVSTFQTINVSSKGDNFQHAGRIREIREEVVVEPYYVYFYAQNLERQKSYHYKRKNDMQNIAKTQQERFYRRPV